MKIRNIFVPLIALSLSSNSYTMLQQHVAQAEEPQQEVPQREIKPLALLAAHALIDQPRPWYSWKSTTDNLLTAPIDQLCKTAIAIESHSAKGAWDMLFTFHPTQHTPKLLKIVTDDILHQIAHHPTHILTQKNVYSAVLPGKVPKYTYRTVDQVHTLLAYTLSQSPEFARAQQAYFPHIQIQPGQLNLEQTLLLLLIPFSQNQFLAAMAQFNANNILTQKAFKTLPEELQHTLRARFTPLRITHLTRRNLAIMCAIDTAAMFYFKQPPLTFPAPGKDVYKDDLPRVNEDQEDITPFTLNLLYDFILYNIKNCKITKKYNFSTLFLERLELEGTYNSEPITIKLQLAQKEMDLLDLDIYFLLSEQSSNLIPRWLWMEKINTQTTLNLLPDEFRKNFISYEMNERESFKRFCNTLGILSLSRTLTPLLFANPKINFGLGRELSWVFLFKGIPCACAYIGKPQWSSGLRRFLTTLGLLQHLIKIVDFANPIRTFRLADIPHYNISFVYNKILNYLAHKSAEFEARHR